MAKCDFELVKELYDVTAQLLLVCGTGQVEDLDAWRFVELDTRYQSAIQTFRKHANESLKPKEVMRRIHVRAPAAPNVNEHDADFPEYRGVNWQRLLIEYFNISNSGRRWFSSADYSELARTLRMERNHMVHKDLYDQGYLIRNESARPFRYLLTDKGRRASRAYRMAL